MFLHTHTLFIMKQHLQRVRQSTDVKGWQLDCFLNDCVEIGDRPWPAGVPVIMPGSIEMVTT